MKRVVKIFIFNVSCICIFAMFYYQFRDHFDCQTNQELTLLDYFTLSTTIQAGVGLSDIYPVSVYGKILTITQQMTMLLTNLISLYIFSR